MVSSGTPDPEDRRPLMDELVRALKNFIVRDIIYIIGGASVILSFLYLFNRICIITDSDCTFVWLFAIGISYVIGYCLQESFSLLRFVTTANYFQPRFPLTWLYRRSQHEEWKGIFPDITNGPNCQEEIYKKMREADMEINEKASPDNKTFRERITYHMMIGTTIGPCAFVSGIILLIKAFILNRNCARELNTYLTIGVVIVVLVIVACLLLDWIKGFQFIGPSSLVFGILVFTMAKFYNRNCTCKFNIYLAICVLTISILLILFGWIKGLQLMKNTEALYNSLQRNVIIMEDT